MKLSSILLSAGLMLLAPLASQAQNDSKYGETEEQQLLCKEALSVYKSYKKQKNYDEAYIQWRKACEVCPETASEGLYADGTAFIGKELKKVDAEDPRYAVLVDSLMYLHDKRMELYPSTKRSPNNRCVVLGRKASDFYKYNKDAHQEAYTMFKESLDCLGAEASATTLYQYYTASFYTMKRSLKGDTLAQNNMRAQMLTDYLNLVDYIEAGVARATEAGKERDLKRYEKAKKNIETVFVAIADCDDMVPVLATAVVADSANMELKQKVLRLLNKKECTDNDLFLPVATLQRGALCACGLRHWHRLCQVQPARLELRLHGRRRGALRRLQRQIDLPLEDRSDRQLLGTQRHGQIIRTEGVVPRCRKRRCVHAHRRCHCGKLQRMQRRRLGQPLRVLGGQRLLCQSQALERRTG